MAKLSVKRLAKSFGAEIENLSPTIPLGEEIISELQLLFDEHGLLIFRNIDADLKFQTYLSELLSGNNIKNVNDLVLKDKFFISNREPTGVAQYGRLLYHSDQMWSSSDRVDVISLYGLQIDQPVIPTLFVSTAEAWATLPDDLRARIAGHEVLQHYDAETYRKRAAGDGDVLVSTFEMDDASQITKLDFVHPRTGTTVLYICQQTTQEVLGLPKDESDALLEDLFEHMYVGADELAHHWQERDLVVWDNISVQHARPNVKADGPARTLRKTLTPLPKSSAKPAARKLAVQER